MTTEQTEVTDDRWTEEGQIIAEVDLGRGQLVLKRSLFKGNRLIDLRRWVKPLIPGGELIATHKGLSLQPLQWRAILQDLVEAVDAGSSSAEDEAEA
ncbi:MAG: transcriptional coactivator p15/PC4 family protein [Armatimonadetes bacterium]|nr:transcriptional coactivator p15/PC4 family protein [Armatimonadota bacterium]